MSVMEGACIGIDLGTANCLVCTKEKGIVIREPSVVAYDLASDRVIAVGAEAKRMIGKTPYGITTVKPLRTALSPISD